MEWCWCVKCVCAGAVEASSNVPEDQEPTSRNGCAAVRSSSSRHRTNMGGAPGDLTVVLRAPAPASTFPPKSTNFDKYIAGSVKEIGGRREATTSVCSRAREVFVSWTDIGPQTETI